jgi:hypothetical protein
MPLPVFTMPQVFLLPQQKNVGRPKEFPVTQVGPVGN